MKRAKQGSQGGGDYYRIEIQPSNQFVDFRYHDVGDPGHIQRLAGRRQDGTWATQAWLISKEDAHLDGEQLIPDTDDAWEVIHELGSIPKHIKGDIFEAKDRRSRPKREKNEQEKPLFGMAGGKAKKHQ